MIVHHLALPFRLPLGPGLLGEWLPKRLVNAISFNGYEGVFIFFVISGFLITTRIIDRHGDLARVDLRRFYAARTRRILPLLAATLVLLGVFAFLGIPGFAPDPDRQTIAGLVGSALTFTFNLYEGRTGWAPAAWDVLWSLSIEELFYLGFPLLCIWLPRRVFIGMLVVFALVLVPLRDLVPASDEIWREKAYLPGMSAIAWGVLAAMLARRWRPSSRDARALAIFGGFCILLVLGWGDMVHRHLFKSGMYWLCAGACLVLIGCYAQAPAPKRGLHWLAHMGALSYELYLSHMFVVLGTVAAYRALLGKDPFWTFAVYVPALAVCYALAILLQRVFSRLPFRSGANGLLPARRAG